MATSKKPAQVTKGNKKSRLSPQQIMAIDLLAIGTKQISVCERIGITRQTIDRWLKSQNFTEALDERISADRKQVWRETRSLARKAFQAIDRLLTDPDTPPAVVASIATKILKLDSIPSAIEEDTEPTVPKTVPPEVLKEKTEEIYGI